MVVPANSASVWSCQKQQQLRCLCCRDPKDAPPEALAWLTNYLQAFQDALEAPDWLRYGRWWRIAGVG